MMDKKIILGVIIVILLLGVSFGVYSFLNNDNNQNTTNKTNITKINNTTKANNTTNNEVKTNATKSTKKYYCPQCDAYHPKPIKQYHRYGNCPICGKYVDTQTTSHTHDSSPGYEEEPREDT